MVRTRFAPSPTGKLHVGNVRTALFSYLYAKHMNGKFVLRIEDTDMERSHSDYTEKLMEDLKWLGLDWDEGPQTGGPAGSYFQSERLEIYKEYSEKLLKDGRAYHCYCTPEEIEERKAKQTAEGKPPYYDGHCKHITESEKKRFESEGRKPVIRFAVFDEDFKFTDSVKGEVNFPKGMVGDFVIIRANGISVYNYAVVIDDAEMQITHVLRADEHLSNTVRQLMIYKAHGFNVPEFAHMALVLGTDRQKLSKRHGAASVDEFRSLGYLPDALANYLSLLGWSSPDGREILSRDELIRLFDIDRLSPSPAVFDINKLDWIAKHYIINESSDRIFELALPFIKETEILKDDYYKSEDNIRFLKGVIGLTKGYCSHLSEIKNHIGYFLTDDYDIDAEAMKYLQKPEAETVIQKFREAVSLETRAINEEVFGELAGKIIKETGIKGKNFFIPIRAALTGRPQGPEIYFLLPVIGKERTLKRLQKILEMLK